MSRYALPALCAIALWTVFLAPTQAQTPVKPSAKPLAKPATAAATPDIVGSVDGKKVSWNQFIAWLRTSSPEKLKANVGRVIGAPISEKLFGPSGSDKVVFTREEALNELHTHPTIEIVNLLNLMLINDALGNEAAKAGITVTAAQIEARLNLMFKDARAQGIIAPGVTNDQFLSQHNLSMSMERVYIRTQLVWLALTRQTLEKQIGHSLSPADFIQARHILISTRTEPPAKDKADQAKLDAAALAKITKIQSDIQTGKKKFEDAAEESSEDPSSKDKGGDLGIFARGMMVPDFESAAFALKTGEVSKIIKSTYGYHIIRVDKVGKDLTEAQRDQAIQTFAQQKLQAHIQELASSSTIQVLLKPAESDMAGMFRPSMQSARRPMPPPRPATH